MWNTLVYHPIVNAILFLYKYLGENLGIAIISIVIILRIILWPLTNFQIKSSKKMQELQPKLRELRAKPQSEMTLADIGISKSLLAGCIGGCLPTLIQIPFLIAIYNAIKNIATSTGTVFNDIVYSSALKFPEGYMFNTHFLGIDLAKIPSAIGFQTTEIIPYIVLCLLVGALQLASNKLLTPAQAKKEKNKKVAQESSKKWKEEDTSQDMSKMMRTETQILIPIMVVMISFTLPAALSMYWAMQSILAIIQAAIYNYGKYPLLVLQRKITLRDMFKKIE